MRYILLDFFSVSVWPAGQLGRLKWGEGWMGHARLRVCTKDTSPCSQEDHCNQIVSKQKISNNYNMWIKLYYYNMWYCYMQSQACSLGLDL